jgi:serine/threonine protein phosphatase PrpC
MSDVTTVPVENLHSAVRSDPGRVRTNNEDLPLVDTLRGVYGVIDGVGGHAAGEVAAAIAGDVILQRLGRPIGTPGERVREAIAIANNEIFRRAEESPALKGMACVITLAIVTDGLLTIGHVGDSRLYKIGTGGLRKLTHDHSPVGEREDAQEMSEADAMRHPRRNEVFRDVGSYYRDKDEQEFVDVIEEPFERDAAILLCTDGLSDMVPSALIEGIVRHHAGSPDQVVGALIEAANEAGGRDNVTVVYAEAPEFAMALRGSRGTATLPSSAVPAGRVDADVPSVESAAAAIRDGVPALPRGHIARIARAIARSRTTWFALGAVGGVLAVLAVLWRTGAATTIPPRVLVVGGTEVGAFARIADAMSSARAGDTVRLEPGVYRERVMMADGVDLAARVPGTVTIGRPLDASGEVVGLTALGNQGGRISGVRIESTPELPMDVGLRIADAGWTLELMEVSGPMRPGIEVLPESTVTITGSLLSVQGPAIVLGDRSQATLLNNVLLRVQGGSAPRETAAARNAAVEAPIAMSGSAQATMKRNVIAGYGADIIKGVSPAVRQQILAGNFILATAPASAR